MALWLTWVCICLARQHTEELQSCHAQQDPAKQTAAADTAAADPIGDFNHAGDLYNRQELVDVAIK
jgi:hypothetical protein